MRTGRVGKHEGAGRDLSPIREGRSSEEDNLGPSLGLKMTPEDLDLLRQGRGGAQGLAGKVDSRGGKREKGRGQTRPRDSQNREAKYFI